MIKEFADTLYQLLKEPLPGMEAHKTMAPVTRPIKNFDVADYPDAKRACVLLLLYEKQDAIQMVLIKRPSYDGVHGGQVSFPGGKAEVGDIDEPYTAKRETMEEIGIPMEEIHIIGKLSDVYIPPSNFFVFPYIGYVENEPVFIADKTEVDYIIETPIDILLKEEIKGFTTIQRKEATFNAPCYNIAGETVWGATAIILTEMEWLLKKMRRD